LPYESNTTLRELGILLFLAGVGVNAGAQLDRVSGGDALLLFGLGAALTLTATTVSLVLLRKWAGASPISCLGATSGVQTQPANLAAAYELAGRTEEVYVSYALTYPVAMIGKILLAQVLATL
jgi:putative transport protein